METTPLLPAWIVLPVAVMTLLVLGGQFWVISRSPMDAQRRRLRQATTLVMMLLTPLAAYGFGIAAPARGREYVVVWVLIAAVLFIVIMLALLDMLHSMRLYRAQTASVRRQLAEARAREIAGALAEARATASPSTCTTASPSARATASRSALGGEAVPRKRNETFKPKDHPRGTDDHDA